MDRRLPHIILLTRDAADYDLLTYGNGEENGKEPSCELLTDVSKE
ncbi:MAG: hypothetical protein ACE5QF_02475 [Thermoplasmata archaeon]